MLGHVLNAAIGLQVLIGSLITGLSAVTTGKQASYALPTTVISGSSVPHRRLSLPRFSVGFHAKPCNINARRLLTYYF